MGSNHSMVPSQVGGYEYREVTRSTPKYFGVATLIGDLASLGCLDHHLSHVEFPGYELGGYAANSFLGIMLGISIHRPVVLWQPNSRSLDDYS